MLAFFRFEETVILDRRLHAVVVRMIPQIVVIIAFFNEINCSGLVLSFAVVINRDFKTQRSL